MGKLARSLVVLLCAFTSVGARGCEPEDSPSGGDPSGTGAGRCEGPDGKTLANRYICLPEGARCAGQTLPCCTFECESNDGQPFNPDDDPARYLTCDTKADACVKKSGSSGGGFCGTAKPSTLYSCAPGSLQCFVDVDASGKVNGGHCCPPDRPFFCLRDKTCYSTNLSASQACRLGSACWQCVEPESGGGGPCDAAGTWRFDCPPSASACGVCGVIPKGSVEIPISAAVAASGGTFTHGGLKMTFNKSTCTLSYTGTCGATYTANLSGASPNMKATYVCATDCAKCGTATCTARKL